jgi:hypothetical protein
MPDDYLEYGARQHGMDNGRYDWQVNPAPLSLKSGARAAAFIVVPIELFPLNPPAEPFKHPGAMVTPYPDLRHYTTRDYGNRVGVFRILNELRRAGLKASFAINAEAARHMPPLLQAITEQGHEIAAHGVSTAHIHHAGLDEQTEREWIADCRTTLPEATTWMSPARNESFATPDLIVEAGFATLLDFEADQCPRRFGVRKGQLTALPLMNELSDFTLMGARRQRDEEWADQIIEAARFHVDAHDREGATCFGFTLTPYIAGQPFRIASLRRVLNTLAEMDSLDVLPAGEMAGAFTAVR